MKKSGTTKGESPSQLIIRELSDWRGETLARLRMLIKEADLEVVEEWKWRGVPGVVACRNHLHGRAEHVEASCRSPRPASEETKERLRSVVKPAK